MSNLALLALVAMRSINHDGTLYGPGQPAGDRFECKPDEAKALLDCGAAKLASDVAAVAPAPDTGLAQEDVANFRALAVAAEADKASALAAAELAKDAEQQALQAAADEKLRADALQAELDALRAAAAKPAAAKPADAKAGGKK
jgi:hypothetical protein